MTDNMKSKKLKLYDIVHPTKEWSDETNLAPKFCCEISSQFTWHDFTKYKGIVEDIMDGEADVRWLGNNIPNELYNAWWNKKDLVVIGNLKSDKIDKQ